MPKGARQYRSVRDDLSRACSELAAVERQLLLQTTALRLIASRAGRLEDIRRARRELDEMFHPGAAAFVVRDIARAFGCEETIERHSPLALAA